MGVFDRLLQTDAEKIGKRESKKMEIKRLSKLIGEPFIVTLTPLTSEQFSYIGEMSKNDTDIRCNAVLEACKIEKKKISCQELLDKFGVVTGREVLEKLFLVGEIGEIYNKISDMSGYGRKTVEEIKN